MCITHSVGRKGINRRDEVKTVQILLNLCLAKLIPLRPLDEDGRIGDPNKSLTVAAIEEFQRRVPLVLKPDGRVDPNGGTLRKLRASMADGFSESKLRGIMTQASKANIIRYAQALNLKMTANQINTPMRMAHFLAQIGHESGDLRYAEEIASGEDYEGRVDLGNTQPGDGKRFKGRGLIQLTGRANYQKYGDARGTAFTTDDGAKLLASDPNLAVDGACWFWKEHGLNGLADADDVMAITKTINGGYNGLEDRRAHLARAKCFFVK